MTNRHILRLVVVLFFGTVAVQNSFGLGIRQPEQGAAATGQNDAFRYVTTRASLQMVNINPTVAFQVCTNLSFGVGYDYFYADTDVRRAFPFVGPGPSFLGEGNIRFQGHGDGHGFNVGGLWKI